MIDKSIAMDSKSKRSGGILQMIIDDIITEPQN